MTDASALSGREPSKDGITSGVIIRIEPTLLGVRLLGAASRGIFLQILSEDEASEMELALVEAATNIVKHGFSGMTGCHLTAELKVDDTSIDVVLRDNGPAFNPLAASVSAPWTQGNYKDFDALPENGVGLGLIIELTDEQSYKRDNEENALRLRKTHKLASK